MKRVDLQFIRKPSEDQISFARFDVLSLNCIEEGTIFLSFCAITFAELETDNGDKIVNE